MAFDTHSNFAFSLVAVAPAPAASGTSLTVTAGEGVKFAGFPFNCTVSAGASATNAEIVRVTNVVGDVLTIVRAQEGTAARTIVVGDQIAMTITAKSLTDIESTFVPPGHGSPQGVVSAPPGSTYLDLDTGDFGVKATGTGSSGWLAIVGGPWALILLCLLFGFSSYGQSPVLRQFATTNGPTPLTNIIRFIGTNGLGSAAFSSSSSFDAANAAHDATNGLGSAAFKATSFFDLSNAAHDATNGLLSAAFHAASDFDLANAAHDATNGLLSAAFHAASDFATPAQLVAATNTTTLAAQGLATKAYADATTNNADLVRAAQLVASTNTTTLHNQGLALDTELVAATNTTTLASQGLATKAYADATTNNADIVRAAQLVAATNTTTLASQGLATKVYADASSATVSNGITPRLIKSLGITIDGGGSAITSGAKGYLEVPCACTVLSATILADQSGSIAIETWRTNSASIPPTRAGAMFTNYLTSAQASTDSTLTGNTSLALAAQDRIGFNVTTNALSITRITLQLRVQP